MGALATLGQSLRWLLGFPILIAAFLIGDLLSTTQYLVSPALSPVVQIGGAILSLVLGGIAYVYVDREVRDEAVAFGDAVGEVLGRLLSLLGIFIVYAIAVVIGSILLVLPGIYLGARLILAFPACVLDEKGVSDSLSISWEVADGNVLKLVAIFVLSLLPLFGVFLVGALTGNIQSPEDVQNPTVLALSAPISAIVGGMIEMATARVYLENK
jgi:hypothetical protein